MEREELQSLLPGIMSTMILAGLLLLVPISLALAYWLHASPLWVFLSAGLAIIPLAEWIRRATDHLASRAGPSIGGLLNVTFGSVAELTLAPFALAGGHPDIVKAQITGSIISTGLLGLRMAIIVGGWKHEKQTFLRERASLLGSLLSTSVIAHRETTWFEGLLLIAASIADSIRSKGRVSFGDNDVHFATGSAALAGDSQAVLNQTARALQTNSDWKMRVVGHTDSTGSSAANDQLAQQRASSCSVQAIADRLFTGSEIAHQA